MKCFRGFVIMAFLAFAPMAEADDDLTPDPGAKPKWELGVAAFSAYIFDYPGSAQNHFNAVVLPFAVYRSRLFHADQNGLRGKLARTDRLELNLGVSAGFSTRSDRNEDRQGMPNLDYILEFGPSLEYKMGVWDHGSLTAVGQVRAAFAARSRIRYVGVTAEPQLVYEQKRFMHPRVQLRLSLGPKFGLDGFNGYYYSVAPQYATAVRPAYKADNGYLYSTLNSRLSFAATRRLSLFVANQLLLGKGSANADSPLYRKDFNYAFGAGFAYSLFMSRDVAYQD